MKSGPTSIFDLLDFGAHYGKQAERVREKVKEQQRLKYYPMSEDRVELHSIQQKFERTEGVLDVIQKPKDKEFVKEHFKHADRILEDRKQAKVGEK